ncbi:matrin 3-like 1.1 isoform X2 [Brachyhypopomus gauderio]
MSRNYSYRSPPDDYRLHQDMYSDSESDIYGPRTRSVPQEVMRSAASSSRALDSPVRMPGKAASFLHSCGLEQSDLALHEKRPEHLMTGEMHPKLLFQIKERKGSSIPSSRSSTTSPHGTVEYPFNRPERPTYSLPPEHGHSWQDRWGNHRRAGSSTTTTTGSKTIVDYGHTRIGKPHSKQGYNSAATKASSTVSQSYRDHSRASRRNLEHLPPVTLDTFPKVPTKTEASDFLGRVPPVFPYSCILCDITVLSEKDWSVHIRGAQHANSQLEVVEKYPQWDQQFESARRNECQVTPLSKYTEKRDPKREETMARKKTIPEKDTNRLRHIKGSHHANSQHELRAQHPKLDHHIEPSRRSECQVIPQPKATGTRGFKTPTRKEASDFHGSIPRVFPYACGLCNITVLSGNDWSLHIKGAPHANSQLKLLEKYPDWDQHIESAKRSECQEISTSSEKTALLKGGAKKENTSNTKNMPNIKTEPVKAEGKVVCVEFEVNSVKEEYLKKLLGQFGAIVKVIMFPTLAFVEMESKDQSKDIVKYFNNNPLELEGKRVEFSVSAAFTFLQSSRVVSFSPLPAGDGISSELKGIAKRFGSIKNSLFLPSRGYIEMSNTQDAHRLVQQYSANPLKLKRKIIQVSFSSEYENLKDQQFDDGTPRCYPRRRPGSERHGSQTDSPSPKRRYSAERSHSSRTCSSAEEDDDDQSMERSRTSSRRSSVCLHSTAKDCVAELTEYTEVKMSASYDEAATMDSDSDLEGVMVIADDEEELQHDTDFDGEPRTENGPEDNQKVDQEQNTCKEASQQEDQASSTTLVMAEQSTSAGVEEVKNSGRKHQANLSSDTVAVSNIHSKLQVKYLEGARKDPMKTSNGLKKVQIHKEQKGQDVKIEEENSCDIRETVENLIILDELVEEISSDNQESDELKPSTQETEPFGKVLDIRNLPAKKYTELDFVNIAKRYGEVKHYLLFQSCKKGLIEMANASDAERLAADSKNQDIALRGNILKIKVSEKYVSLPTTGLSAYSDSDEEQECKEARSKASSNNRRKTSNCKSICTSDTADELMAELSNEPQNPREPVGTEHVHSVVGYC